MPEDMPGPVGQLDMSGNMRMDGYSFQVRKGSLGGCALRRWWQLVGVSCGLDMQVRHVGRG